MKHTLIFILGIIASFSDLTLITEFHFPGNKFEVDHLNNLYSIAENSVSIVDHKGNVKSTYSNNQYGEIFSIDVTNPMKIPVFYRLSKQVVILDNRLNPLQKSMDLTLLPDFDVSLISYSINNHLWLYDSFSQRIVRIDRNLKTVNQTGILTGFLPNDFAPVKILEHDETLYALSEKYGIATFDIFGSYIKLIPLAGLADFQVRENVIIYQQANKIKSYNMLTHLETTLEIPVSKDTVLKVRKARFYALKDNMMKVFKYENN